MNKNVVLGGFRNIQGNVNIGDTYINKTQESYDKSIEHYLSNLPPIPESIKFPQQPFVGIKWFTREDARIFFGRSEIIFQLYNQLSSSKTDNLIIIYGQSGVGKSSLLHAGLFPRIESSWDITSIRNFDVKDIAPILEKKYLANKKEPQLVVLDQFEEVIFNKNKILVDIIINKIEGLIDKNIKVLLSLRKEYIAELEYVLVGNKFNYTKIFIPPLDSRNIIEAIIGITKKPESRLKYNLNIEDKLPEKIANDILIDDKSLVAPSLQLLLTKLWNLANKENPQAPIINSELYNGELIKSGIHLKDYFNVQITEIKNINNIWVESGLVLDVLYGFTTEQVTAGGKSRDKLKNEYRHIDNLDQLIEILKTSFFILEEKNLDDKVLRLSHDSLAPIVIEKFNNSAHIGQLARKILNSRVLISNSILALDNKDLEIVEKGVCGMRIHNELEKKIIDKSKKKRKKESLVKTIFLYLGLILVFIISFLTLHTFKQNKEIKSKEKEIKSKEKEIKLNYWIAEGNFIGESNPNKTFRLFSKVFSELPSEENYSRLRTFYKKKEFNRFYKSLKISNKENSPNFIALYPNDESIIFESNDSLIKQSIFGGSDFLLYLNGLTFLELRNDEIFFISENEEMKEIFELDLKSKKLEKRLTLPNTCLDVSEMHETENSIYFFEKELSSLDRDSFFLYIFSKKHKKWRNLSVPMLDQYIVNFSINDNDTLAIVTFQAGASDGYYVTILWNLVSNTYKEYKYDPRFTTCLSWIPKENYLLCCAVGGEVYVLDTLGNYIHGLCGNIEEIEEIIWLDNNLALVSRNKILFWDLGFVRELHHGTKFLHYPIMEFTLGEYQYTRNVQISKDLSKILVQCSEDEYFLFRPYSKIQINSMDSLIRGLYPFFFDDLSKEEKDKYGF